MRAMQAGDYSLAGDAESIRECGDARIKPAD